jgi:hypothetical protein
VKQPKKLRRKALARARRKLAALQSRNARPRTIKRQKDRWAKRTAAQFMYDRLQDG